MKSYEFPVSAENGVLPPIGQGFNLIAGETVDNQGFDTPPMSALVRSTLNESRSRLAKIFDSSSYTSEMSAQLDISGSGWGASAGMSLSESSFSASSGSSVTLNLDAADAHQQAMVVRSTSLSDEARAALKADFISFTGDYGTHFVAGYVFGKRCSLAYQMMFQSQESRDSFAAHLNASYSGVDFSGSMTAALNTASTASQSKTTTKIVCHTSGFLGTTTPAKFEDIEDYRNAYDNAPLGEDTPIRIIVVPWNYLSEIRHAGELITDEATRATAIGLAATYGYIISTGTDFISSKRYCGHSQFDAVAKLVSKAQQQQSQLSELMRNRIQANKALTLDDLATLPDSSELEDDFNFALRTFTLAFRIKLDDRADDANTLLTQAGDPIKVANRWLDGAGGVSLNWSIEGNDGWEGTKGTTKNFHPIGRMIQNGNLVSNVMAILDRENGTLQIAVCGINETLQENAFSSTQVIRGSGNRLPCDAPHNHSGISGWGGTHGVQAYACPI